MTRKSYSIVEWKAQEIAWKTKIKIKKHGNMLCIKNISSVWERIFSQNDVMSWEQHGTYQVWDGQAGHT